MQHTLWVPGAPKVKGRPRSTKSGNVYTPKETLAEEARIASLYDGPVFTGPVGMEITYYKDGQIITIFERPEPEGKFRGDLDNYLKLTGDALQGKAFANDKQVTRINALLDGGLIGGNPEEFWRLGTVPDLEGSDV